MVETIGLDASLPPLVELELLMPQIELTMPPTVLAKTPPDTNVLADRAFSACAHYYPNLNAMVTPFFLDGRKQFT
jgi:hypothetical protein